MGALHVTKVVLCSHFQQVFRVTLAHGTEVLAKDFLLVSFLPASPLPLLHFKMQRAKPWLGDVGDACFQQRQIIAFPMICQKPVAICSPFASFHKALH